jgi:hypothetical protein
MSPQMWGASTLWEQNSASPTLNGFQLWDLKALLSFSQCTQGAPCKHESSSAERRNFSVFEKILLSEEMKISDLECSVAVLYIHLDELCKVLKQAPYSEKALPQGFT